MATAVRPLSKIKRIYERPTNPATGGSRRRHIPTYVYDPERNVTYGIDHIPSKLTIITRQGDPLRDDRGEVIRNAAGKIRRDRKTGRTIKIYDTGGFFQRPFADVLDDWDVGTPAERAQIRAGKAQRDDFTVPLPEEVKDYNALECRLLAEVITKVDAAAEDAGIRLESWHGAGAVADALLAKHDVAAYRSDPQTVPAEVQHVARCAFAGGRFETARTGIVPTMWENDIASAYPAGTVSLPCLAHGKWQRRRFKGARGVTGADAAFRDWLTAAPEATALRVMWEIPLDFFHTISPFAPFPYRDRTGKLLYPPSGHGWYWKPEVDKALEVYGPECFTVAEAWWWE